MSWENTTYLRKWDIRAVRIAVMRGGNGPAAGRKFVNKTEMLGANNWRLMEIRDFIKTVQCWMYLSLNR